YVAWLSQETGRAYRLPSEAEWEYACRAGTTTRYSFGDAITPKKANYGDLGFARTSKVDSYPAKPSGRTSEVGSYPANPWGLYDMHGNVWVEDDWHESYQGAPSDGSAWKDASSRQNPPLCVLRGGSGTYDSRSCRSACRGWYRAGGDGWGSALGFR